MNYIFSLKSYLHVSIHWTPPPVQIEDLSSQAQIQAAEKFKAPEVSAITGKEAEEETAAADGGEESEGEEVSLALILS